MTQLTIAIAKGRLQGGTLELLAKSGLCDTRDALSSRRLAIEDESGRFRFIFVKPMDVPVYVAHGIADCGIVGRDVLMESEADLLQPLTLGIGRCRIVVAAPADKPGNDYGMLRVATKYPHIAVAHFGARGQPVEVIELSGSVELAPVLGLADCIVEVIAESTGRLVVNRASYQLKAKAVGTLIAALEATKCEGDLQSD